MRLLVAKEVKELFRFSSEARVYEAARLGLIPSVRIGRQIRFNEDALRDLIVRGGSVAGSQTNGNESHTAVTNGSGV